MFRHVYLLLVLRFQIKLQQRFHIVLFLKVEVFFFLDYLIDNFTLQGIVIVYLYTIRYHNTLTCEDADPNFSHHLLPMPL